MKNKLIKINKDSLIRLYKSKLSSSEGFESIGITYISNNPIISYIWWSRLQAMIDLASKVKAEKVLDFGCGEGVLLPSLSNIYNIFQPYPYRDYDRSQLLNHWHTQKYF